MGATLADGFIVFVPTLILLTMFGVGIAVSSDTGSGAGVGAFAGGLILTILAFFVGALLYWPLLMRRSGPRNGQTLGKQLLGIRVVRANGSPVDFGSAALREIVIKGFAVGIASSIIPVLPWLLDVLWPLWDGERRALHDMAASTRVVSAD